MASMALAVLLATAAGACGGSTKVGSGLETKTSSAPPAGCRLGECTTTTTAPSRPSSTTTTTLAKSTATTRATTATAVAPTTTAVQTSVFSIQIQSDTEPGGHFNPSNSTVPRGTLVRWTNTDTLTRSVEAEDGSFRSPPIAPGASWEYRAATAGTFEYHDGTRPYAVGNLHVR